MDDSHVFVSFLFRSIGFVILLIPICHARLSWYCHSNRVLRTHRYRYCWKLSCLRDNKEKSRYEVCTNYTNSNN